VQAWLAVAAEHAVVAAVQAWLAVVAEHAVVAAVQAWLAVAVQAWLAVARVWLASGFRPAHAVRTQESRSPEPRTEMRC